MGKELYYNPEIPSGRIIKKYAPYAKLVLIKDKNEYAKMKPILNMAITRILNP